MYSLGDRLKMARKGLGLTQTELSKICNFSNVSKARICLYERNYRVPSHDTLITLSRALNVSLDYLISGNEFKKIEPKTVKRFSYKI